jgi:lysophospholipase L1-like esterase
MERFNTIIKLLILLVCLRESPGYSQNSIKIMPLGNSITRGETDGSITEDQMKGYRYDLKQLLQAAGYPVDFVGSESAGYSFFNDCEHAGIGGSRDQYVARLLVDGYDERWGEQIINPPGPYLDVFNPDIILLHIGTNDCTHETETELYDNENINYILDLVDQYEARAQREVIVFLALIINRKDHAQGYYTTTQWNIFIKNIALNRIANGDKIVIVDMENDAGFLYTSADMADDLHPNSVGYGKMAALWTTSIMANYNTAPVITGIPDQILDEDDSTTILLDTYVTDLQDADQDISWAVSQLGEAHLNITINSNRQATTTPVDENWYGTQTVVFTATDQGKNGKYIKSCTDTVIFNVMPVNDPPVFTSSPVLSVDKGAQYLYMYSAEDVDVGDVLQYSLIEFPSWLSIYPTSNLLAGIPQHAGSYSVTLRVSDGNADVDQSYSIDVIGSSGISENENDHSFYVFPNPATDMITLQIKDKSEDLEFLLFDITGKPVLKKSICRNCVDEINLKEYNLRSGLYMYRIISNQTAYAGKLMIN